MIWKVVILILVYIIQAKLWYKFGQLKSKKIQSKMVDEIIARDCEIHYLKEHIENS